MSRPVPYDKNLKCDNCGKAGAFDFMGDYFCSDCLGSCEKCEAVFVYNLEKSKSEQKVCSECRDAELPLERTKSIQKATDPITKAWDTPEEDAAWEHLSRKTPSS